MQSFLCLKKIEMFGFKSFADRTQVLFDKGVTCIVGPNGCGKSNISDAIRWVLGERSPKHLRGAQMMDVVFAGTEFRKPISMAEVNLTFDNHRRWLPIDYNEVVITRRLFRTGESEYLINKTRCRYRDIQALIVDTGLGVDTYSMIEQGRVDHILNASPEDRRGLIEEAAGIAKYKKQKEESLRKLGHTEENLLRIKDIVLEVERNIKYAERQAKRAARYKRQLEELRTLDITKAFIDIDRWRQERALVEQEIARIKEEAAGAEAELEEHRTAFAELENEVGRIDAELRNDVEARAAVREKAEHLRAQTASKSDDIRDLGESALRDEKAADELKPKLAALEDEERRIREECRVTSEASEKLKHKAEYEGTRSEFDRLKAQVEQQERTAAELRDRAFEAADLFLRQKNELERVSNELSHEHQRSIRLAGILERQKKEQAKVRADLDSFQTEGMDADATERDTVAEFDQKLAAKEALDERIRTESVRLRETQKELSTLTAHTDTLKQLGKKGYLPWRVASSVLGRDESKTDKFNDLACEIIKVIKPKRGYERVFRMALGRFIDAVVVKDRNTAEALLDHITRHKLGEAMVLLADLPVSTWPADDIRSDNPAVKGAAIDFVECEDAYRSLAESLFRGTYLVGAWLSERRDEIRRLAVQNVRLITEDGFIVGPGHRLEGGFTSDSEDPALTIDGLSWEEAKRNLAAAARAVKELEEGLNRAESEKQTLSLWLKNTEEKVRTVRVRREAGSRIRLQMEQDIQRLEDEIALSERDIEDSDKRSQDYRRDKEALEGKIAGAEQADKETKGLLAEALSRHRELEKARDQLGQAVAEMESEVKHLSAKEELRTKTYVSLQENIALIASHIQEKSESARAYYKKKEALQLDLEETRDLLVKLEAGEISSSETIRILENRIDELKSRRRTINETIEALHRKVGERKDAAHEKSMALSELSHRESTVKHDIHQVYKIQLDELSREEYAAPAAEEMPQFDDRHEKLKKTVEAMGAVNILAVEEYDELKTRYDFLTGQQRDLEDARASLLEAVRKINRTTRKLFIDTFHQVRSAFEQYYRTLFRGGHGELLLLDESNPLESGIDIRVRPPGKKLQHISLFSGGEKAMTAIALLFALFKVKPSPFCVLDEVDAPLDEANIDRFIEVLGEFLQTTQFLIITHSRKTIASGDTLYGITMEESGVSKIVSVRVADEVEEPSVHNKSEELAAVHTE